MKFVQVFTFRESSPWLSDSRISQERLFHFSPLRDMEKEFDESRGWREVGGLRVGMSQLAKSCFFG